MNSTVILIQSPPYEGTKAKEALDMIYAFASFDQPVTPVFIEDGIYQLITHQQSELIHQKNTSKMVSALPMFGIDNIHYLDDSLSMRGLDKGSLLPIATPIDMTVLSTLLHQSKFTITI